MTCKILQTGALPPPLAAQLGARFELVSLLDQADKAAYLAAHGGAFELAVTNATAPTDAALIGAMPRLRAICSLGVGYDRIDLTAARARGIVVSNTPDVLNDCVADLAFGLLIDVARGLTAQDRFVRRGDWPTQMPALGTRVSGKKLGIVGLGRIGQQIVRRSLGFDMQVAYHARNAVKASPLRHEASLEKLAGWGDFLVIACAGGSATQGLVSEAVIRAMPAHAYLINISRGSVVDEPALVRALQEGRIAGAGLDVFAEEPNVPHALVALENVVLLPHIASGTRETRKAMADLVLANIERFVASGELVTPVTP